MVWDELSDERKRLWVARARRIPVLLVTNFNVAEQFTGQPGYVPVAETVRGFKEIPEGKTMTTFQEDASVVLVQSKTLLLGLKKWDFKR